MRNILLISKKELISYFTSPIAYVVAILITLALGIIFYANLQLADYYSGSTYQAYIPNAQLFIGPLVTILLFTTPAITMRTFSEENRSGTLEVLLTAPIRDHELIIGKWLGSIAFLSLILLVTMCYPVILNMLVDPGIDFGIVISGYIGVFLLICVFTSIGISISSLFSNQIAAFFATLIILLGLWLISSPTELVDISFDTLIRYLDLRMHFYPTLYYGILDLSDVIYFVSLTTLSLFLGTKSIESRRWR